MDRIERAAQILSAAGHRVTMMQTTGPGTAGEIARRSIEAGAGLIVAAGGDGTINETVNGMAFSRVPLAILPGGTANVLATELGLGRRMDRAAEMIAVSGPVRVALGRICAGDAPPRYFLLFAGAGLDARMVYDVNADLKMRAGKLAYWVSGLALLGRTLPEFDVLVNGRARRAGFALAARVRNYGGAFEIARTVTLVDDSFELVLFEGRNTLRYLFYFGAMLAGRLAGTPGVTVLRADCAEFRAVGDPPVYVHVDGECIGRLPASIDIVPQALTLLAPPLFLRKAKTRAWTTSPIPSPV